MKKTIVISVLSCLLLFFFSCSKESEKTQSNSTTQSVLTPKTDNGFHRILIWHHDTEGKPTPECIHYKLCNCMDDVVIHGESTIYNNFRKSVIADTVGSFISNNETWREIFPEISTLHSNAMDSVADGYYKIVLTTNDQNGSDMFIIERSNIYPNIRLNGDTVTDIIFSFPVFPLAQ